MSWLMCLTAVASILATLPVPARLIDHGVARGLRGEQRDTAAGEKPSGFRLSPT